MTAHQLIVEMLSITKRFLNVTANKGISFRLYPGEICALLGENGAGKTTMMNILFGYYACDEGEIFIKGDKVDLTCPRDAICRGVGMIHLHFALVPSQSVLENVIIGTDTGKGVFLNLKSSKEKLRQIQKRFRLQLDVYFHAVGGPAAFLAQTVTRVLGVYKLEEFGVPEAMWVIEVKDFPAVVTMDAHGQSKHAVIDEKSKKVLDDLLQKA